MTCVRLPDSSVQQGIEPVEYQSQVCHLTPRATMLLLLPPSAAFAFRRRRCPP